MGRTPNQKKNLKEHNEEEKNAKTKTSVNFSEVLEFVIALIYCGFPESKGQDFAILIGKVPPNYYEMTKAFNFLRPIIKKMVEICLLNERKKMKKGSVVSMDGSWDHRRDGKMIIYDVIYLETKKIVYFSLKIQRSQKRHGNTDVCPQALEGQAFKDLLPTLMSDSNINEVVKDGDLQIESMIMNSGWMVNITPDPNHLLKNFDTLFKNAIKPNNEMFRGISKIVLKQLKYILYNDSPKEVKYKQVEDMKNYILNQPIIKLGRAKEKHKWKHANSPEAIISLNKVMNLCNEIVFGFDRGHSTCINECYHSLKGKFVPKDYNLGNTCDVRLYASILQFNMGDDWLTEIFTSLKLNISRIKLFKEFHSKSRAHLKKIRPNNNYFEDEQKKEEKREMQNHQLQIDRQNHIPIHK